MNYAIILAGGTGQRMRTSGMPKQFLDVYGKPIIVYTLETFQDCEAIDQIIIPCNADWLGHMQRLTEKYGLTKVRHIVVGGKDRTSSIWAGINAVRQQLTGDDVLVIHDGVRPLVRPETIEENVAVTMEHGNAMTVRANVETVVVTAEDAAKWTDFKNRNITYTLTSPQTFKALELIDVLTEVDALNAESDVPILDASLAYARLGKDVYLVKESGNNLKITTPEDYYYLKAYLELQESKHILGV